MPKHETEKEAERESGTRKDVNNPRLLRLLATYLEEN